MTLNPLRRRSNFVYLPEWSLPEKKEKKIKKEKERCEGTTNGHHGN